MEQRKHDSFVRLNIFFVRIAFVLFIWEPKPHVCGEAVSGISAFICWRSPENLGFADCRATSKMRLSLQSQLDNESSQAQEYLLHINHFTAVEVLDSYAVVS